MKDEAAFLQAMQEHPEDNSLRLVFADWLDERGDPRGELIRLRDTLTQSVEVPERGKLEDRLRFLLASGVQPVGPFWSNSIGMKFAWIPAGTFLMGSPVDEEGRGEDETQYRVVLTRGFWLAVHPVTHAAWQKVTGEKFRRSEEEEDLPVAGMWWQVPTVEGLPNCQGFLRKLSDTDGNPYRLPTEAEWEYACRAGTTTPYYFGKTLSTEQASYDRKKPTPVGSFPPNAFGLYDMHGNVFEWCNDWYGEYPTGEVVDPQGPQEESAFRFEVPGSEEEAPTRVVRGGYYYWFGAGGLRSADRCVGASGTGGVTGIGIRPAMTHGSRRT